MSGLEDEYFSGAEELGELVFGEFEDREGLTGEEIAEIYERMRVRINQETPIIF